MIFEGGNWSGPIASDSLAQPYVSWSLQKRRVVGRDDGFRHAWQARKLAFIEIEMPDILGLDHGMEIIRREAEAHVFQGERLHVSRVKPPCRQRPGIDARAFDGHLCLGCRVAARELNLRVANHDVSDGRIGPALDGHCGAINAGRVQAAHGDFAHGIARLGPEHHGRGDVLHDVVGSKGVSPSPGERGKELTEDVRDGSMHAYGATNPDGI